MLFKKTVNLIMAPFNKLVVQLQKHAANQERTIETAHLMIDVLNTQVAEAECEVALANKQIGRLQKVLNV